MNSGKSKGYIARIYSFIPRQTIKTTKLIHKKA